MYSLIFLVFVRFFSYSLERSLFYFLLLLSLLLFECNYTVFCPLLSDLVNLEKESVMRWFVNHGNRFRIEANAGFLYDIRKYAKNAQMTGKLNVQLAWLALKRHQWWWAGLPIWVAKALLQHSIRGTNRESPRCWIISFIHLKATQHSIFESLVLDCGFSNRPSLHDIL